MTGRVVIAFMVVAAACGGARRAPVQPMATPGCAGDQSWDGRQCRPLSGDTAALRRGIEQVSAFHPDQAVQSLTEAQQRGPYRHRDHVALYEKLSVAHAYMGDEAAAVAGFDMVLALSPGHAISYTLSPRATFLFEKARKLAVEREQPSIRVTWPRDLRVDRPVRVEVEVVADPKSFLSRARLFARRHGERAFSVFDVELPREGAYRRVILPAIAPRSRRAEMLDLYLTAYDRGGNEVLLWQDASRPAELPLAYDPPTPWYRKWWVWTAGGTAVATATGIVVWALLREPPDEIGGDVDVR